VLGREAKRVVQRNEKIHSVLTDYRWREEGGAPIDPGAWSRDRAELNEVESHHATLRDGGGNFCFLSCRGGSCADLV
jgi:hypothetical protein